MNKIIHLITVAFFLAGCISIQLPTKQQHATTEHEKNDTQTKPTPVESTQIQKPAIQEQDAAQKVELPKVKPISKIEKPDFYQIFKTHPKGDDRFLNALNLSKSYYLKNGVQKNIFTYDDINYTGAQMLSSMVLFEKLLNENESLEQFVSKLEENFDVFESKNEKNSTLITGYYAPILKGSFEKSEKYSAPIYPVPDKLVTANLKKFSQSLPNREIIGVVNEKEFIPFYSREEIENGAIIETQPLMYLQNKIDSFFLEVQGSGIVETEDGQKYYVGFAGKNGRPYSSIGNVFAKEKLIPSDKINMQTIKDYMLNNPSSIQRILNTNESYVFFKINTKEGVFGNIQLPLTAKHSIAMDSQLMPKGGLVYIKTAIPYKKNESETVVPRSQREPFEKFFFTQDTGGAIRGGGRVDIYFGEGDEAFFYAGQMAGKGDIYLLVAKKDKIEPEEAPKVELNPSSNNNIKK